MRSNYRQLGDYIEVVNKRNTHLKVKKLLGVSIQKSFMPSIANTVGTDMSKYKIVRNKQFAYGPVTSRNGDKVSIALLEDEVEAIVSQAYTVFEVTNHEELDPEYLMMWFRRPEFDRYARFKSHGSAREIFDWEEMCNVELPVPSIETQRAIVAEYNAVVNRISLNEQLNQKLEETARAIYKHWFEDFDFPDENGKPYKTSGGNMVYDEELEQEIPEGWILSPMLDITTKVGSGATPKGGKDSYKSSGIPLVRSQNVHDFNFVYKDLAFIDDEQANKLSNVILEAGDVLLNITGASVARCCLVPKSILSGRVNQHVAIIRLSPDTVSSYYLLCALCSSSHKAELIGISESGSTREAITKTDIENFKVLFPDKKVMQNFTEKLEVIFEQKYLLSQELKSLKKMQTVILSKLTKIKQ